MAQRWIRTWGTMAAGAILWGSTGLWLQSDLNSSHGLLTGLTQPTISQCDPVNDLSGCRSS